MAGNHFSLIEVGPGVDGVFKAIAAVHELFEDEKSFALVPKGADIAGLNLSQAPHCGEPALLLLTSGSTGNPRVIEIPVSALAQSAEAAAVYMKQMAVWLTALPVTSMGGLNTLVRSALTGIEPVIWDGVGGQTSFTHENFLPFIKAVKTASLKASIASAVSLVPTQIFRLAQNKAAMTELAELDFVLVGGAALSDSLKEECASYGIKLVTTYGATETVGGCVFNGKPLDGYEVSIVNGLVQIQSDSLAWGYRDGEALNGVWRSKDRGELENGILRILGRTDSVVKVSGVLVDLQELETKLQNRFTGKEIYVVAIDDEQYGNLPIAFCNRPIPDFEKAISEISNNALPIKFKQISEFPLLATGKIDRSALRELRP
jgi:O-succinylbenzoic acid--CoA ligase